MKTVGIVADNYKLEMFKKELTEQKFKFDIFPFVDTTSTIKVYTLIHRINEIQSICNKLEIHFKQSN